MKSSCLGMMRLDRKCAGEKILYVFVAALLILSNLKMNYIYGISYIPYAEKEFSASIGDTPRSMVNATFMMIDKWRREIIINTWGGISGSDYYLIANNQPKEIHHITFNLPANATVTSVQDAYEDYSESMIVTSVREGYTQINMTLIRPLRSNERNEFLIAYDLPSSRYITKRNWQDYTLELNLVKPENWYINEFQLIISLPEGAGLISVSDNRCKVERQGLSTKIVLAERDLIEFQSPRITLNYQYFILWGVFKPLMWTALAALFGAALFFIKKFLRPPTRVTPVSIGALREFVEVYYEKRRLSKEIEDLQRRFRSGRISRKRLRLRRRSLDQKLSTLNKRLADLKNQVLAAAEQYEEAMRELETAEAEIETLNADIERVETRFRRGEISSEARRRLLNEYSRIKERAERTISEILLRLEEGI